MNLLDIITNRPLTELPEDAPSCPFCASQDLHTRSSEQTNRITTSYACKQCDKTFTRTCKLAAVWYSIRIEHDTHVLKGIPMYSQGCHAFNCATPDCKGLVRTEYFDLEGRPNPPTLLIIPGGKLQYKVFYICRTCFAGCAGPHDNYMKDAGL